jgi:hypothetical protein
MPETTCRFTAQTKYLVALLWASLLIVSVLSSIIGYSYSAGRPKSDQPPGIGGLLPPADPTNGFSMSKSIGVGAPVAPTPTIVLSFLSNLRVTSVNSVYY